GGPPRQGPVGRGSPRGCQPGERGPAMIALTPVEALPREIELLQRAASFLAECQDLDEVKDLRDKAEALRLYQKKIGDSQRAQNAAAEIKIRAERRMGELLQEQGPKHGGDRRSDSRCHHGNLKDI